VKKSALIFIEDGSFTYDNRVIREADALSKAGWKVIVISPKYPGDFFYKKINNDLFIYHYPKLSFKSLWSHAIEGLFTLFFGSLLTLFVYLRHGFSVFHACNPMDILWIIALPYKTIGKKFIFDQHDLCIELCLSRGSITPKSLTFKMLTFMEAMSYKLANAVIATNESYKDIAIKRGGKNPQSIFVVRNGPDLNKFRPVPPKAGIKNQNEILVGYLGNINPQDGADYLLKAAFRVIKECNRSDIKFVFIGDGMSKSELIRLSDDMQLKENVIFTGRIPDEEMLSVLSACDICVQPDPLNLLNDKSTMNKAMEYMALKKPVITFDLKETRVSCGGAALYVTPNDISELADKIIYLADNHDIRDNFSNAGRERIEKELAWEYSIPNLLKAYDYALRY
jgi:glycosyltransferase involved in cell wall biosynthesis